MTFQALNIIDPILQTLAFEEYFEPSPIQMQAIPVLLEGKDILASAQTGTGKTAAFAIPIIQALYQKPTQHPKKIKALILAPTRELAEQIKESFRTYSHGLNLKSEVIYGGVSQRNQETALKRGVDVLIATPGRLLDLMSQRLIDLNFVEYFVLDEADRMLDMGFIHDVRRIVTCVPKQRQTMLFSATIPNEILKLANELLTNPVRIEVTPPEAMIELIKQSVYFVAKKEKTNLLIDLMVNPKLQSILIFTRTKHGANKLVKELLAYGIKADAIHGNKSQNKRQQALMDFKVGKLRVLVATDIAARGIDIDELSHVINYDLPETPETYVHRMGRTGRAGHTGEAYSFCSQDENHLLVSIEKHIRMQLPVIEDHPFHVSKRLTQAYSDQPISKQSKSILKNKTNKDQTKPMKKYSNEKQKKSYHTLQEEQSLKKDVFKRSLQPRVKPIVIKDDAEKPKYVPKNKGYQPKDFDRDERSFRSNEQRTSGPKKPYTPRTTQGSSAQGGYKSNQNSTPQQGYRQGQGGSNQNQYRSNQNTTSQGNYRPKSNNNQSRPQSYNKNG